MKGQSADRRRDIATLRKKRKEEKIGIVLYNLVFKFVCGLLPGGADQVENLRHMLTI